MLLEPAPRARVPRAPRREGTETSRATARGGAREARAPRRPARATRASSSPSARAEGARGRVRGGRREKVQLSFHAHPVESSRGWVGGCGVDAVQTSHAGGSHAGRPPPTPAASPRSTRFEKKRPKASEGAPPPPVSPRSAGALGGVSHRGNPPGVVLLARRDAARASGPGLVLALPLLLFHERQPEQLVGRVVVVVVRLGGLPGEPRDEGAARRPRRRTPPRSERDGRRAAPGEDAARAGASAGSGQARRGASAAVGGARRALPGQAPPRADRGVPGEDEAAGEEAPGSTQGGDGPRGGDASPARGARPAPDPRGHERGGARGHGRAPRGGGQGGPGATRRVQAQQRLGAGGDGARGEAEA